MKLNIRKLLVTEIFNQNLKEFETIDKVGSPGEYFEHNL